VLPSGTSELLGDIIDPFSDIARLNKLCPQEEGESYGNISVVGRVDGRRERYSPELRAAFILGFEVVFGQVEVGIDPGTC